MSENPFDTQALDDDQKNRIEILRGAFRDLYATFSDYLCGSRYTSLAVTALEEAAMWANKSVAFEAVEARKFIEKQSVRPEVIAPLNPAHTEPLVDEKCCSSGQCCKE